MQGVYILYIKNMQYFSNDCFYISKRAINKRNIEMARVLISMPEEFLSKIDQVADGENRTRSELIREALRTYIHKQKVKENALAIKNANILESLLD